MAAHKKATFNFFRITRQTYHASRSRYYKTERPITMDRLWSSIYPNLKSPIFVIGSPRSGTTFLGECIEKLPEICYHFEPVATKFAANYVYTKAWDIQKTKRYYRMVYAWLMRQHMDGDLRFAEKTPRNCFLIDFLYETFPNAQFIHIIRDGRDAALSHNRKPWLKATHTNSDKYESGGFRVGPYARFWVEKERIKEFESTQDIHRCIWAWRRHTESALQAAKKLPKGQYHELRYELLASNPILEAERLLDFLNIDNQNSRRHFFNAVSKVHASSVGGYYEAFSKEDFSLVYQEAGELLNRLGYLDSSLA